MRWQILPKFQGFEYRDIKLQCGDFTPSWASQGAWAEPVHGCYALGVVFQGDQKQWTRPQLCFLHYLTSSEFSAEEIWVKKKNNDRSVSNSILIMQKSSLCSNFAPCVTRWGTLHCFYGFGLVRVCLFPS